MAERVDVCIVGSGLRRLDLRLPARRALPGGRPVARACMVLERGPRHQHTDFRQSMDIELLSRIYGLVQGQGAQIVVGDGVGGGSNLYLAASLRSPSETFERRDHRPDDGPDRRMWPAQISRATLDPYYARVEAALRVQRPTWNQVAKSGGLWAATLDNAGHTCDRVPVAIDLEPLHPGEVVPHGLHLRRQELGDHELPRLGRADGRAGAAELAGGAGHAEHLAPLPLRGERRPRSTTTAPTRRAQPTGNTIEIECKVLILSAGAMGNDAAADALAPGAAEPLRRRSASTSASTATTSPRSSTTSRRCATCSGCPATASSTRATTSRR